MRPILFTPWASLPGVASAFAQGVPTVRAVRLDQPLRVDGRLDDPLYTLAPPLSGFVQTEPSAGAPATERTDVWLSFDRDNVYVTMRAWESEPERMIGNEMRRDGTNITQNENVAFVFDTFHDGRNGIVFNINPIGGRMGGQISNPTSVLKLEEVYAVGGPSETLC